MNMENKFVKVSFNVEMAKKIQNKEIEGKIVTPENKEVRIICWDRKDSERPIVGLIYDYKLNKELVELFSDGNTDDYKFENDLFLEIPEYMTFKDGDIVTSGWKDAEESYCSWISVIKKIKIDGYDIETWDYVTMYLESNDTDLSKSRLAFDTYSNTDEWVRKATEEEKQKLIDALKASNDPRAKEYLKRFFGIDIPKDSNSSQIGKNYEFKLFDKVIVRAEENCPWRARFFERMDGDGYACTNGMKYKYCLPCNEQTARLVGTINDWIENK